MKVVAEIKEREIWIDNIKVLACVLVVLGHFLQSMTKANIVPNNGLYQWFNQSIYFFHVPLFFICSGYVYQKYSKVDNFENWRRNILKKVLALGVPYFSFTLVTWILKTVFSNSVNDQIGNLLHVLFLHPTAPYWYLYCLFLCFLITPTFKNRKIAFCGLLIALVFKVGALVGVGGAYALSIVLTNEIWFVVGMYLCTVNVCKFFEKITSFCWGLGLTISFIIGSIMAFQESANGINSFVLGICACMAVVFIFGYIFRSNVQNNFFGFLSKYTMPIFLMHTIFAATLRSVFFKIGITNSVIHVVIGLIVSFLGPIIAAKGMCRFKWMEFFLYPTKHIKLESDKKSKN